jgi:hypothetical protein
MNKRIYALSALVESFLMNCQDLFPFVTSVYITKISARRTSESWWNSKSDNQSISDQSGCSVYSFRHPIFPSLVCNVSIDVLREFTWECSILFSIGDSVTHSWKAEFSPGCWFWSLYPFYSHHSLQRSRPCIVFYCTMDRYKNLYLCNYCKLLHHV